MAFILTIALVLPPPYLGSLVLRVGSIGKNEPLLRHYSSTLEYVVRRLTRAFSLKLITKYYAQRSKCISTGDPS